METICKVCGKECSSIMSLSSHYTQGHKISTKEYYDKYYKTDDDGKCVICGKPTKFAKMHYAKACSQSCRNIWIHQNRTDEQKKELAKKISDSNKTDESLEKRKQTNRERYGCDYTTQNSNVQEKRRQTCQEKYGVDCTFQADSVKEKIQKSIIDHFGEDGLSSKSVNEKKKKTCQERYGVDNPYQSEEIKEKIKQHNLKTYGVEYSGQRKDVIENIKNVKIQNKKVFCDENDCIPLQEVISMYGNGFIQAKIIEPLEYKSIYYVKNSDIPKIEDYFNKMQNYHSSNQQEELYEYIKSVYNGEIKINNRTAIHPYELDIYIPDLKLAVEFNGNYWHSSACISSTYHLEKSLRCKDKGIRLIHIFEHEWNNKQEICKSIIQSALNLTEKIYARNCIIKEVSNLDAKMFLLKNHLQGSVPSSYRLGLYYNNELVQLITIGKSRFEKGNYELLRMCTKTFTTVVGGFSKLIKNQPYNLISYIDFSKYNGVGYLNSGFEYCNMTKPNYVYWNRHQKIIKRYDAQKHKLAKLLGDKFNKNKTELQNMLDAGYYQIYDCGNIKVMYKS